MTSNLTNSWQAPAKFPWLAPSEIHAWRINLVQTDATINRLKNCLSKEECQRAASFHFSQGQRRFIVRRAILRQLLAAYLNDRPETIQFLPMENGKPAAMSPAGSTEIRFSSSHSADYGLIAISCGRELGVDLEQHRSLAEIAELAQACFSPREITAWADIPDSLKLRAFFDGWTRKEAFVKALGLGLSYPLKNFSVSLMNEPAELLDVENDPRAVGHWSMQSLDVQPGHSGALVFEGKQAVLQCYDWNSHTLAT